MKTPNKVKNSRKVTFTEDYKIGDRVYFEKDSTHFMHVSLAEKLKGRKAKIKVEEIDYEKSVSKAKEVLRKQKEAQKKANQD